MYSVILHTFDVAESLDTLNVPGLEAVAYEEIGSTFDGLIELRASGGIYEIQRVCDIVDLDYTEIYMNETS